MSVRPVRERVHVLPKTVISRYSNTYAKKQKRLGVIILPHWRLIMVIFIYSNILLSVSMMNITILRVSMRPRKATSTVRSSCTKPPKRRGTKNRYSTLTRTTNPSVYNTSSTITVHYHSFGYTKEECYARCKHMHGYTKRERKRERHTKCTKH